MCNKIVSILKKTKKNGFSWFFNRLLQEFRTPETPIGKKLKPLNKAFYKALSIFNWLKPKASLYPDTLCVFYDLEVSPITFDLCWVLCLADLYRQQQALKYVRIIFVPGPEDGLRKEMVDYETLVNPEARYWRLYHLLYPLTRLLPTCTGFTHCSSRQEAEWIKKNIDARFYPINYHPMFPTPHTPQAIYKTTTSEFMALRATKQALLYLQSWLKSKSLQRKTITVTLREYEYTPKRNSNIAEWAKFLQSIDPTQYFIVIVPDIDHAMEPPHPSLSSFTHFTEACWNVELRAALYHSSYLNLGINNGPMGLCWMNSACRYILFKLITEEVPQANTESFRKLGCVPNQTPAFATKYQKWVWQEDKADIIQKEFEVMCSLIDAELDYRKDS